MSTLTVKANAPCALFLNGGFLTFLKEENEYTLPMPQGCAMLSAHPFDSRYSALDYFIEDKLLLSCGGRLCRWSEELFELFFVFTFSPCCLPPIITKEAEWAKGYAGICGGYFVFEKNDRKAYPTPVEDFFIISQTHMLLKGIQGFCVIDEDLNEVLPPMKLTDFSVDNGLSLTFSPGDMELIRIHRKYSPQMHLLSTAAELESCQTPTDRLRLFCQAVRLDLKNEALSFLTEDLKEAMPFEEIKEFLGIFDQVDIPRYSFAGIKNSIALRYMVNESNFHYMCYEFTIDTTTGVALIDDIAQL